MTEKGVVRVKRRSQHEAMNLLDNASSESSDVESEHEQPKRELALEDSDGSTDETLQVNEKFAERFEKRKRAQDLRAAKNLDLDLGSDNEDGSGSSTDSETEDEDAEMLTPALDLKIMKTINKIRSKDPDIYDTGKAWFSDVDGGGEGEDEGQEDDEDSEEEGMNPRHSQKPMRYKDVVREQILQARSAEEAISSDEDDEGREGGEEGRGRKELAYDEEQEELRKGFLGSVAEINSRRGGEGSDEEGDGNGLLKVRQKTAAEVAEEEELLKKEAEKMADQGDGGEEEDFLKDFVANRRWLDPHAKKTPSYDEILNAPHVEDSEDEEDVDRADEFESKYNFRFEEDGGREIAMHSRNVPGSMRRKDDRRKRERENRKARKAEERQRKEAELRRLKNLKREEIQKRLKAIQEMSGGALVDEGLGGADAGAGGEKGVGSHAQALLDEDFDPQRWDAVTQRAFDDGYYEAEDADDGWKPGDDPLEGLGDLDRYTEKPETDAAWAVADGSWQVDAAEEEVDHDDAEEEGSYEELDDEGEADGGGGELGTLGVQKEKLLDELYKLDYEDIIGDIPCRFKYTNVKPSDFGLSPEEILLADDKELNKYVPLKKLAPYRADEPKLDARHRRRLREEIKEREKTVEVELLALRAKKKRRGKRKTASPAAAATSAVPSCDVGPGDRADSTDVTGELAGGKRRRRKKGQKKQRARTGGDGGGDEDSDGVKDPRDAADMVPRVRPMAPPSAGAEDESGGLEQKRDGWGKASASRVSGGNDADDANDAKGKRRKKRGRKRGRSSEGGSKNVEDEGDGAAGASVAHSAGDNEDAVPAADRPGPKTNSAEKNSTKKIRRESVGQDSDGSRKRSAGKDGVGERGAQKAPKRIDPSTAKLAKATGVSKSRLASYGL